MARFDLIRAEWTIIPPLRPKAASGQPDDRKILIGIFCVLRTGASRRGPGGALSSKQGATYIKYGPPSLINLRSSPINLFYGALDSNVLLILSSHSRRNRI
jgi:hypothetical protein